MLRLTWRTSVVALAELLTAPGTTTRRLVLDNNPIFGTLGFPRGLLLVGVLGLGSWAVLDARGRASGLARCDDGPPVLGTSAASLRLLLAGLACFVVSELHSTRPGIWVLREVTRELG